MVAESGSGMRSMSLSSIDWNPRMLEPSKPSPSVKLSTSSSPSGRLKCCHVPGRSTKRTSTTSTPSAFARSRTSRGLVLLTAFFSTTAIDTLPEHMLISRAPRTHRNGGLRGHRHAAPPDPNRRPLGLCGLCLSRASPLDHDQEERPVRNDSGDVQSCHGFIFSDAHGLKYIRSTRN